MWEDKSNVSPFYAETWTGRAGAFRRAAGAAATAASAWMAAANCCAMLLSMSQFFGLCMDNGEVEDRLRS